MKIACVSDCHGKLNEVVKKAKMPKADVLVIAGDYCPNFPSMGETDDARKQLEWIKNNFNPFLKTLDFAKIIVVAGNHDWCHYVKETKVTARHAYTNAVYLEDEAYEFEGVSFYGSPWQPWFWDWAFNFDRMDPITGYGQAKKTWAMIPDAVDVVITHGPPLGIRDECMDGRKVGCPELEKRIFRVNPKLHVFGHIHFGYGSEEKGKTRFVNAALCDEKYKATQDIQVFEVSPSFLGEKGLLKVNNESWRPL